MKKNIKLKLLFIFIILIFIVGLNINNIKLLCLGYNFHDVSLIKDKLDSDDLELVIDSKYNKYLTKIIYSENYNSNKLSLYLNVFKKYKYDSNIIDIINEKYYIKSLSDRYILFYYNNLDYSKKDIISMVNCNLDYDYYTHTLNSDLSNKELVLVNKFNMLSKDYKPENLVKIDKKYGYENYIDKDTYEAFIKMYNDIKKQGLSLFITSAYRSYDYQNKIYNNYVKQDGREKADTYSARPGFSEHQTGLAIDVSAGRTVYTKFEKTKEYQWMKDNSYKYGFILRYQKNTQHLTGYNFEAWHYRYVGLEVAKYIYDNNITFDEYYQYFLNQ